MNEEWTEVKFNNKINDKKITDEIKIRAWDLMYNQHHERNFEWEHYPASAYEIIQLMDSSYNQAKRIKEIEKNSQETP